MLTTGYTERVLNEFKKFVIQQSRSRLTKGRKKYGSYKDTNKLYNSIKGEVSVIKNNAFSLSFFMEDYGKFQDKGVSGTEKKYDTPFSYKSKMPPIEPLAKWAKRKGLKLRDSKGKFKKGWNNDSSYRTIGFLISRSIQRKGLKPSLFFTKPFEQAFKKLPDELLEAYGLDVEEFLQFTLNKK